MILNRTNVVLSILLAIVVFMTVAGRVDYTRPNIEILPDMKYSPAWATYRQNPVFANGRTLQEPVTGTIARGQLPLHFEPTKEDALRAGEELQNPYRSDVDPTELQDSINRGGDAYRVFCISCHGATGAGDGPVAKRGFPPPPSLLTGNSPKMKDGQLFHILTYGGQTSMPDFAAQLSPELRWDVINYIRSMQQKRDSAITPNGSVPADGQDEPGSPASDEASTDEADTEEQITEEQP